MEVQLIQKATHGCNFVNNSTAYGGAIYATDRASLSFNGTSNFNNNRADSGYGGAIISMSNTSLSFIGISNFNNNSVDKGDGGAIYAEYNVPLNFTGTSNFCNNSATDGRGGGVYLNTSRFFIVPNHRVSIIESVDSISVHLRVFS